MPSTDLVEVGVRLGESRDNFLQLLDLYGTGGRNLVRMVVERLERQLDPAKRRSAELVKAADDLRVHLRGFDSLSIQLASSAGFMGFAVTSRITLLGAEHLFALGQVRPEPTDSERPTESITQYIQALKSANERSWELISTLAVAIAGQTIEAFDSASDFLTLRMYRLLAYLAETDPPEEIKGSKGWTYRLAAVRGAIAREAVFTAGEEALKRLPTEFAGQVPLLAAFVSIGRISADVHKELKAMDERRALWEQILNAPWERGPDDATFDGRTAVTKDDLELETLFRSLNDYATALLALPSPARA